jgi:hypothetical protein
MASNDNNKRKMEEVESLTVRKHLRHTDDDDDDDDDSSDSLEEESEEEEEVSSEETSMNQQRFHQMLRRRRMPLWTKPAKILRPYLTNFMMVLRIIKPRNRWRTWLL